MKRFTSGIGMEKNGSSASGSWVLDSLFDESPIKNFIDYRGVGQ
jgi:hypothetical protein